MCVCENKHNFTILQEFGKGSLGARREDWHGCAVHLAWHGVTTSKKIPHKDVVLCCANPAWSTWGEKTQRILMCD